MNKTKNCVKCGRNLKDNQKLRCESCIRYVDAELRWETDLPLHFFFKWNLRHKK